MNLGDGLGHLTYSTLVHPGDTWLQMRASLETFVPQVKAKVSPDAPFGVSLRLSGASVEHLITQPAERQELIDFLDSNDLYLYTVNAFPYGPFKDQVVKELVYEPDWTTETRLRYTTDIADLLAEITPTWIRPSIQTAPLAYAPNVTGPDVVDRLTANLLRCVAHLIRLEERTGRVIRLALEPEPACFLETTEETVAYFRDHLFTAAGYRALASLAGVSVAAAQGGLRRHLGVVFDIGHQSVGFEDIPESLERLVAAGIPIFKLQQAAALWVPEVTPAVVDELRHFADTIYLSQTVQRRDGALRKFLNLEDAIAAWEADPAPQEWRTHFHVPVFLDDLGAFRTTRFAVAEALAVHLRTPLSDHLEIETYTWDVLPERLKTGSITDYVTRELEWVTDQLTGPTRAPPERTLA